MTWPFSIMVTGRSGSGKTNLLANLVLGDKNEYICCASYHILREIDAGARDITIYGNITM